MFGREVLGPITTGCMRPFGPGTNKNEINNAFSAHSVSRQRLGCQQSNGSSAADSKAASQLLVGLIVTQHDAPPFNEASTRELVQPDRRCRSTPVTMASPPVLEPFERARKKVWSNLTANEKNELAGTCTIEDVWGVAADIQENQGKKGGLGNMNKIRPYLDGLRRYDDVIKVLISSNPGILALIWVDYTRSNLVVPTDMETLGPNQVLVAGLVPITNGEWPVVFMRNRLRATTFIVTINC